MTVENLQIVGLEERHLGDAVALSGEAHWNQTKADWRLMMTAGRAVGIEDGAGRLVASALALPYGTSFGWVSMVLVTGARQGDGLARRLLADCNRWLEEAKLIPVVDATPAGEGIYRAMGFAGRFGIQRWEHDAVERIDLRTATHGTPNVLDAMDMDMDVVLALDRRVFGGERRQVLEDLAARSTGFCGQDSGGGGFVLGRNGRVASQIGPLVAEGPQMANVLLDHALAKLTGPVFIDVGDHQTEFLGTLKAYGFRPQRPFLRMVKGDGANIGAHAQMFAMAGPELG